jgi:hypothetical protein
VLAFCVMDLGGGDQRVVDAPTSKQDLVLLAADLPCLPTGADALLLGLGVVVRDEERRPYVRTVRTMPEIGP